MNSYRPNIDRLSWSLLENFKVTDVWNNIEVHIKKSIALESVECMQIITVDEYLRLKRSAILSTGTVDHIEVPIRLVVEYALSKNSRGILLAHNHTSGITNPSWPDLSYTKSLNFALHSVDVILIDHLIVGNDIFSFRKNGMIF